MGEVGRCFKGVSAAPGKKSFRTQRPRGPPPVGKSQFRCGVRSVAHHATPAKKLFPIKRRALCGERSVRESAPAELLRSAQGGGHIQNAPARCGFMLQNIRSICRSVCRNVMPSVSPAGAQRTISCSTGPRQCRFRVRQVRERGKSKDVFM